MSGPHREKPDTQKLQTDQLWDTVIGTNGKGLIAKAERQEEVNAKNEEDHAALKADMAYVRGHIEGHIGTEKAPAKTITIRRILEVATVALVLAVIVGGALMLIIGTLTPEDIVRILSAWKGGGS